MSGKRLISFSIIWLVGFLMGRLSGKGSTGGSILCSTSSVTSTAESVVGKSPHRTMMTAPAAVPVVGEHAAAEPAESGESVATAAATKNDNLPSLEKIFRDSGSDKYHVHRYDHYYDVWFRDYRHTARTFLEIGVFHGASMRSWQEYFGSASKTKIYGLGYGISQEVVDLFQNDTQIQILMGDQSTNETMQRLLDIIIAQDNDYPYWDIIIDDGSHFPEHTVFTFFSLWKSIAPGGVYIIEDLETNYWRPGKDVYGYVLPEGMGWGQNRPDVNAIDKFKQFIDILPRAQLNKDYISIFDGDETICSIEWGKNLVKFRKCTENETQHPPTFAKGVNPKRISTTLNDWLEKAKQSNPGVII